MTGRMNVFAMFLSLMKTNEEILKKIFICGRELRKLCENQQSIKVDSLKNYAKGQ